MLADENSTALQIGDEPKQFKANFPETIVAVAEDRILGVPSVLQVHPETDVILLDDCFQHRQINPGLSILLTAYGNLFTQDSIMPLGWLREAKENYRRADIIIVTKCPQHLNTEEKNSIAAEIKPYRYQKVYFSYLQYAPLYAFENKNLKAEITKDVEVLLLSGIADSSVLKNFLEQKAKKVYERKFRDHHRYDRYDLESIRETFKNIPDEKKIIITTEKDAARLEEHRQWFSENQIPLFVQSVSVDFLFGEKENFDRDILRYVEFAKGKIAQ